jgi:hypothetical protein
MGAIFNGNSKPISSMSDIIAIASLVAPLATQIVNKVLINLGAKYSIGIQDVKYVLNKQVEEDFQKCLNVAIKAFISKLLNDRTLTSSNSTVVMDYLGSSPVIEEIWHLLEPGTEFFDRGSLSNLGYTVLHDHFENLTPESMFDAWEEFLKAFSFASRSTPQFREFLRASYEAGSFKALSNIEDVLERMNTLVSNIHHEELTRRISVKDYTDELKTYRRWATEFANN